MKFEVNDVEIKSPIAKTCDGDSFDKMMSEDMFMTLNNSVECSFGDGTQEGSYISITISIGVVRLGPNIKSLIEIAVIA